MTTRKGRRGMEGGGWREGRDGRRGRSTYLYTGRVAQNAVSNTVSFIFHKRPTAISGLGYPLILLLFSLNFKFRNLVIYFSTFPDAELRLATTRLPASSCISNVALRLSRVSRLGTSAYKPILAFLISLRSAGSATDHLCYHPSLSLLSRHILAFAHTIPLYFLLPLSVSVPND